MAQLRWINTLCLVTIGISGLMSVQSSGLPDCPRTPQPLPWMTCTIPIEITNRVFTPELQDPKSEEYKEMYDEVSNLFDNIYGCCNNACPTHSFYGGVTAMTFSSGSVIAKPTVLFKSLEVNEAICYGYFLQNVHKFKPDNLQINLHYTTLGNITSTTITTTTTTTTATTPTTPTPITTTPSTTTTTPTTTTPTTTTPTTTTTTPTTTTPTTTTPTTTTTTPTTTTTTTKKPIAGSSSGGSSSSGWVPGWVTALLVGLQLMTILTVN